MAQPPDIRSLRQIRCEPWGTVSYEDGSPGAGALIAVTNLATDTQVGVLAADRAGRFESALPRGDYALAVTTDRGFAWVEKQPVPGFDIHVVLARACEPVRGLLRGAMTPTYVRLGRKSGASGDIFVASVKPGGEFAICVPAGYYTAYTTGQTLSFLTDISISPTTRRVEIEGFARDDVQHPPPSLPRIPAGLNVLVDDILSSQPTIIGLGEGTHGTSEFISTRGELTLELIRKARVGLILFELDAISAVALDDYVNGDDVDVTKAVSELGFWVTDTYEFIDFIKLIREYNQNSKKKVHIWGIDAQNTVRPANVLLASAGSLSIDPQDQELLKATTVRRAKDLSRLSPEQRARLDALLSRLQNPLGPAKQDLVISVAARSLALQIDYWAGDMRGEYRGRRDSAMAALAGYLIAQTGAERACLWAHDGHIARQGTTRTLGANLAAIPSLRYYGVGFYLYEGTTRAWDGAQRIGVISHPIPEAPPYLLEGAVMRVTGAPAVAWLPLRGLPEPLRAWLETPRFVREVGAQYTGLDEVTILRHARRSFDALVVIKHGHDSTPTPTGIRKAKQH
jgi:erythromycin esterase